MPNKSPIVKIVRKNGHVSAEPVQPGPAIPAPSQKTPEVTDDADLFARIIKEHCSWMMIGKTKAAITYPTKNSIEFSFKQPLPGGLNASTINAIAAKYNLVAAPLEGGFAYTVALYEKMWRYWTGELVAALGPETINVKLTYDQVSKLAEDILNMYLKRST